MENFNAQSESKGLRTFETMSELVRTMTKLTKVWSWGARGYTNIENKFLRFRVSGHHHKGYVYLGVNSKDLFNIYLVTMTGKLKEKIEDIYIDELIDTIDVKVEKIDKYIF